MKLVYLKDEITLAMRVALGLNQALRGRLAVAKRQLRKLKKSERLQDFPHI
jgi:hypothetical protein